MATIVWVHIILDGVVFTLLELALDPYAKIEPVVGLKHEVRQVLSNSDHPDGSEGEARGRDRGIRCSGVTRVG